MSALAQQPMSPERAPVAPEARAQAPSPAPPAGGALRALSDQSSVGNSGVQAAISAQSALDLSRFPEADRPYYQDVGALFDRALAGDLSGARQGAAATASRFRTERGVKPGQPAEVTDALGKVWHVADSLGRTVKLMAGGRPTEAKAAAHDAAEQARALLAAGLIDEAKAKRIILAAGGYWTAADKAEKKAAPKGGQGALNTPLVDQYTLPHERNWAFCGIATLVGVLRGEGKKVSTGTRADLEALSDGIYVTGSGTSGSGMAERMRGYGLKGASFTMGGTVAGLVKQLAAGKAVPMGVDSIGGKVVDLPNGSTRYPELKKGDSHEHTFGSSGHWVTVVGFEGPADKPTAFLVNDPDTGARLRMSRAELERHSAASDGIWMVTH